MSEIDKSDLDSPPQHTESEMDIYWAAKPRTEIGDLLFKKVEDYYDYLETSGRLALYKRAYDYYYAGYMRGAQLHKDGEEEEFTTTNINHYRNIIIHIVNNTTSQRPNFEPRATNSDYKSQAQTTIASGVLDYYNREKEMEHYTALATEKAAVYAKGYVSSEWDQMAGDTYGPGGEKQGDCEFGAYGPMDVIFDPMLKSSKGRNWLIVRKWKNKWDYAAKYPELAHKIKNLASSEKDKHRHSLGSWEAPGDTDLIPVFVFYHDKTPALPDGRMVEFLSSDCVTLEGPLNYDQIPVREIVPDEQDGTAFGYTIGWDLLAIQQALDMLYSTVLTNQETFGVQNILMPQGANVGVSELSGGLKLITYDAKQTQGMKIEGLNLTATPREIFEFINKLEKTMETIAAVNSVIRGNPEASLKSGAALALVAAQSIQFNSKLQQSYAKLIEGVGTLVINILKAYAKTPRIAEIAGKSNRPLMKQFTGEDLSQINRVTVDMGNPIARTTAGRMQIAEDLLGKDLIKTPEQYLQLVTTGRLEPVIENQQAQLLLIRAENEDIIEGKEVHALATDDHVLHIKEHQIVMASPEAREDPELAQRALAHMMEHINLLRTTDPMLLNILGQPVPQMPAPPPGGPPPSPGGAPDVMDAGNPIQNKAGKVNFPSMPKNPLTGEEFNPSSGGM